MAARPFTVKKNLAGGWPALAAALVLVLVLAALFVLRPWEGLTAGAAAPAQTVTLTINGMSFEPREITVKAGQPVRIVVENHGTMNHAFKIDTLNVSSPTVGPNGRTSVTFTPGKPGDYDFLCPMVGHAALGMVGTLHVTP